MCRPDAPDTSGQNAAALMQANLSKEQLDWMKQLYDDSAPDRKAAIARANLVSDKQLSAMDQQSALTNDYANYQKTAFRPLELGIIDDAQKFDTEKQQEIDAGKAVSDVNQSFSAARDATSRNMARMGVNPGSGAYIAGQQDLEAKQALAQIQGMNGAREKARTLGYARKMDAANLGRNLASNQATSAGVALNQGNSAVANGQVAGNVAAQGAQMMNSGYAGAQNGLAGAANTYGNIANLQMKANQDPGLAGTLGALGGQYLGSAAGSAQVAAMFSDKNMKEKIEPVDPDTALKAIKDTPVSGWQYKEGNQASDGGEKHIGPMAQDVQKNMGNNVAPNGKKIDIISMNGINMAAIQALNKKVDFIASRQGIKLNK